MPHLKVHFLYAACRPGEWLRVGSNGTDGKPTFRRLANLSWFSEIFNHLGEITAWSPKSSKTIAQKIAFSEKEMFPYKQIFQNAFRKDSCGHRTMSCANFVKLVHYLPDKKKQNFHSLSRSRFCADRAQNLSGPAPDNILGVPKFHPNPYTSGGVIAGRVNIIEKVPQSVSKTRRSFFTK